MQTSPRSIAHAGPSCFPLTRLNALLGTGFALAAAGALAQTKTQTTELQEINVTAQAEAAAIGGLQKTYSGGQLARGGDLGILGRTDLMNVPFSTTNYTSELIENQQALTISDVVMNDASVRTLQTRGGYGDDFQVRGYSVGSRDVSMNGLFGLSPATRMPVEMLERVEVLKGPGAFTNGSGPTSTGSIGGSINVVTKRASDIPLTRLTTTYMGKAQLGTHLDVGRRFGEDNQWGVRANGVWRNGEGNLDNGRQRVGLGSLGVDYAGARLRWSGDLLYSENKSIELRPQIGFRAGITQVPDVPDLRSTFYPGVKLKDKAKTAITRLEYDLNERTTVYGGIGYSEVDSQQHFPTAVSRPVDLRPNSQGNFSVNNGYYDEYNKTTSADAGLRTRFNTGTVGHTLVLAANSLRRENSYFYQLTATPVTSNIYNPSPLPAITFARGNPSKAYELSMHSIAVVDTMSFLSDRLRVSLGLRRQTMDQDNFLTGVYNNTVKGSSNTPLVGLVFKPLADTSVYYNYTAGLQAGVVAGPTLSNRGESFPPQKSKQHEIGVKRDWGTLITQVAYYQLERPSSITENNVLSYGGLQRNRGLELSAYGEVMRGLRAMASASFNEAKLVRTASGTNQGNDANGVPDRTFNAGLDWDTPWVSGLSLNGRVINTSSMYYDAANLLRMPSWTRVDLGARYATRVDGKPVVLRATVENVADKAYWVTTSSYATMSAPRTLMLSAQIDF